MPVLSPPTDGVDWLALSSEDLPVDDARSWVAQPNCGAVVCFEGTVRDHSPEADAVTALEYEAYDDPVRDVFRTLASEARTKWPDVERLVVLHRTGTVDLGEPAVVVAVSAPHRTSAFEAARYLIDAAKERAPIWKKEFSVSLVGGSRWATR